MPKVSEAYLEARRSQILEAAWACFCRGGYHETTMQDICRESGLSYGSLYRYFNSKEDILRATSERARSEAQAKIAQARGATSGPMLAVQAVGSAVFGSLVDPMSEAVTRVHIETLPEVLRRPEILATLRAEMDAWRSSMTRLLDDARQAGELPVDVEPAGLSVVLMCVYEGLRIHRLIDPEHFTPETVLHTVGALLGKKGEHAAPAP